MIQQMIKNAKDSPDFTIVVPEIFTNLGLLAMKCKKRPKKGLF